MPEAATLVTLKRRRDFVTLNDNANLCREYSLLVQTLLYGDKNTMSIGFTATRRLGNAVKRNRAKRRLRAAAYPLLCQYGQRGNAYVFIAKPATLTAPFARLQRDIATCLSAPCLSR